ncbi:ATP-binding cassette domain-containing protein [Auraticoccus sp. F435]|uniref:ATP-binding cassette domain-containing protein n=1 Tax=Auraticoccus cholistanensis TaxID=2656650 RepID=A0A6A9UTQ5_9ACTN|nr:ATP-binding cassette domain-containing protein [Auraticoccus cholistanensis]
MSAALLEVEGLSVAAEGRPLVGDLRFAVRSGERVGLIGESGSGKSVTALALMGLLPPGLRAGGSVRLAGRELLGAPEAELSRLRGAQVSMVFQEPMTALNPTMRIGPQVAEVLQVHGRVPDRRSAWQAAVAALADVGLPDPPALARAYPHQLSGGQRQRVVIAIALAGDPALLVCDEPTSALDVTVQGRVLELIRRGLAERGAGCLFISHDLAVVADVCERVLVMHAGRVVEAGPTRRVLTRPQHPYTRGLLAASDLGRTDEHGRLLTMDRFLAGPPPPLTEPAPPWQGTAEDGWATSGGGS